MKRIFCDCCGREVRAGESWKSLSAKISIGPANTIKLEPRAIDVNFEVDLCKYCAIDAFKAADDRPKADDLMRAANLG